MTTLINLKMTVGDNCSDAANPSPARKKGRGNYCPNPDSQVYVSLTYINFLFVIFWGAEFNSLTIISKMLRVAFPTWIYPSHISDTCATQSWYMISEKAKRPGIHDYIGVVLHDTFLPRWIKEQSGYWRAMWYIRYLYMKTVRIRWAIDFIYFIYAVIVNPVNFWRWTDQLDYNWSHAFPHFT